MQTFDKKIKVSLFAKNILEGIETQKAGECKHDKGWELLLNIKTSIEINSNNNDIISYIELIIYIYIFCISKDG